VSEAEAHNDERKRKQQRNRVVAWFAMIFGSVSVAYCWLRGKKTYLLAAGTTIYALLGLVLGEHDLNETGRLLFDAAVLAGLRAGINNSVKKVKD
jgi:uncharacterized membrane protein YiaA